MKTLITGSSGFIGRALLKQNLPGDLHVTSRVSTSLPNGITGHFGDLSDQEFLKHLAEQNLNRSSIWLGKDCQIFQKRIIQEI